MKIEQIIEKKAFPPKQHAEIFALDGHISADTDPDYIRLYRNPLNGRSYYMIRKADIIGDVYAWTAEEKVHAGMVGYEMYRIRLPYGAEFQTVEVTIEKLGETVAGAELLDGVGGAVGGGCRSSSGCGSKPCCVDGSRGCRCSMCCVA